MASIAGVPLNQKQWVEKYARFGFASKGVVYCLIGILTLLAAFGLSSEKGDKTGVFNFLLEQPFGHVLLVVIAAGLTGYVVLRFIQAFASSDGQEKDLKGIIQRVGYLISAILYLGFALYAVRLAMGKPGSGDSRQFIVSKVMEFSFGEWAVGICAAIIIISGINQVYKGVSGKFMKKVKLYHAQYADAFRKTGLIGYVARGIVFCIIGYFLIQAAVHANPREAQGTDAAFDFLRNTFGNLLMGLVAAGTVAYGIFMFVKAKYERINL